MAFITNATAPFVSALDVFQYVDAQGLTVTVTGSYAVLRTADDSYDLYATGKNVYFVSGSGYWGPGSGFTQSNNWFIVQSYDSELTGIYGYTGILPPNFLNYAFSGATASSTGTASFTGLKTYTGYLTSGYTTGLATLIGSTTKTIAIANSGFSTGNNLAYLSGSFSLSATCIAAQSAVFTSGFGGFGSGIQFMGMGTTVCAPMLTFAPTGGSRTFQSGTLEVRFLRSNNYLSGVSNNFILDPNFVAGREPCVGNWSQVGNAGGSRVIGRGSGDGTGFNTISYGNAEAGSVINGGGAGQAATGYVTSNTVIGNGQWYMVSVVSSGLNAFMYLNGVLDATGLLDPHAPNFYVINDGVHFTDMGAIGGTAFYGVIDEVRIWDSLRSSGDIAANWNRTVSPYTGNLAVLFRN